MSLVASLLRCLAAGVLLTASPARAAGTVLETPGALAWAEARARDNWKGFSYSFAQGGQRQEVHWDAYAALSHPLQTRMLLDLFKDVQRHAGARDLALDRRAGLILLARRPLGEWAGAALAVPGPHRGELVQWLARQGYRAPAGSLAAYARLERPWTHGLGLHLDRGERWRLQWLPSPALLPVAAPAPPVPGTLGALPEPGALIHLAQLRPGLARLRALAGSGLAGALAQGNRAGFLLDHAGAWLDRAPSGLAGREAWIAHYGPGRGTLVFLPGDLPGSTRLVLDLLKLNPFSAGARARAATWHSGDGRSAELTQVRAAGGVLNLVARPDGTLLCDREGPLRAVLFPGPETTLGERPEWCRAAFAAMGPDTQASLWVVPRAGGGLPFELAALARREAGPDQPVRALPALAKAAPCTGAAAATLGAGPTGLLFAAILRQDRQPDLADPPVPAFVRGALTPEQDRQRRAEWAALRLRRQRLAALRRQVDALAADLDLQGGAFSWNGWAPQPSLDATERAALVRFQQLRQDDPGKARTLARDRQAGFFGGYGEPGLAPSLALAVAVRPGRSAAVQAAMARILPAAFQGRPERRRAAGVDLHRIRTGQAFTPVWAVAGGMLVLGSDDGAVAAVAAGLMGRVPTLADRPGAAGIGTARLDGARVAAHLETLLQAYTRALDHGAYAWQEAPGERGAEVAPVFGPFLGALRALGARDLRLDWGPGGLTAAALDGDR